MPNAPLAYLRKQTRDNFDPSFVLVAIRSGDVPPEEYPRLLEEACHAFQRNRCLLENARAVVENLRQDLNP